MPDVHWLVTHLRSERPYLHGNGFQADHCLRGSILLWLLPKTRYVRRFLPLFALACRLDSHNCVSLHYLELAL